MEIGCNTFSLKTCSRAEAFAHIRRIGFDMIELWAGHAGYLCPSEAPRTIAEDARSTGLTIRAYCIGGLFGLPSDTATDRLERALAFANDLGVDLVTGIIDRRLLITTDRLCRQQNMRFAIENHWYTDFARVDDYVRPLADCSPAVGVNIDTGHFLFLGCELKTVAAQLGQRTFNVHLKVVRRSGKLGRMMRRLRHQYRLETALPVAHDLAPFVDALSRTGYTGMLAIEHETEDARLCELDLYRKHVTALLPPPHEHPPARV